MGPLWIGAGFGTIVVIILQIISVTLQIKPVAYSSVDIAMLPYEVRCSSGALSNERCYMIEEIQLPILIIKTAVYQYS